MEYQQAIAYIRQQLASGASEDQIRKSLADNGWNESDINAAFATLAMPSVSAGGKAKVGHIKTGILGILVLLAGWFFFPFSSLFSGVENLSGEERDIMRESELSIIRISSELYFDDNGTYPNSLEDLVPKYMQTMPKDPSSGALYQYEKIGDRSFRVCAVSESGKKMCDHSVYAPLSQIAADDSSVGIAIPKNSEFRRIQESINLFYQEHLEFPSSFSELYPKYYDSERPVDEVTGTPYEYEKQGEGGYILCGIVHPEAVGLPFQHCDTVNKGDLQ